MTDINKYVYIPRWIIIWLVLSNLLASYDAVFVLLRPISAIGGSLASYFKLHQLYVVRDTRYADMADAFVIAQAVIGLSEGLLSFFAVFLQYYNVKQRPLASLLALVALTMTWAKTIMYVTIESLDKFKYTGHNSPQDFFLYFALPMGAYIIIPLLGTISIISGFVRAIDVANKETKKK